MKKKQSFYLLGEQKCVLIDKKVTKREQKIQKLRSISPVSFISLKSPKSQFLTEKTNASCFFRQQFRQHS